METPVIYLSEDEESAKAGPLHLPTELRCDFVHDPSAFDILIALANHQTVDFQRVSNWRLIDSPPNPYIDEGFHRYQIQRDSVAVLAAIPHDQIAEVSTAWSKALTVHSILYSSPEELADALAGIRTLAARAIESGQSLYVEVLHR